MSIRFFTLLCLSAIFSLTLKAQDTELQAVLDTKQFYLPDGTPYIETYLNYIGRSLVYTMNADDSLNYAMAETTILVKSGEEIVDFRKFTISSPGMLEGYYSDFLDVQRFTVDAGNYNIEVVMTDENLKSPIEKRIEIEFEVFASAQAKTLSDIMLLEAWSQTEEDSDISKAGYNLLPFVSVTYPGGASQLAFYMEFYNFTGDGEPCVAYTGIRPVGGEAIGNLQRLKKLEPGTVSPLLQAYPINTLTAGKYELVAEIRNSKNELQDERILPFIKLETPLLDNNYLENLTDNEVKNLLSTLTKKDLSIKKKVAKQEELSVAENKEFIYAFFGNAANDPRAAYFLHASAYAPELLKDQASEEMFSLEYTNRQELYEHLHTLRPIAGAVEHNTLDYYMKSAELSTMQQYLFYFWETRAPQNPAGAWQEYQAKVQKADEEFGTRNKRGYMTDRGRVYLQYGPPNTRAQRNNETEFYPYEIWHYYKIGAFNDGKFVFFNPSLGIEDYPLLHSNVRGEILNKSWVQQLYAGNLNVQNLQNQASQFDGQEDVDFRNEPLNLWNNPR